MVWALTILLLAVLQPPAAAVRPEIALSASTSQPFEGEEFAIRLTLRQLNTKASEPVPLRIPWLEADFAWLLPPEQWLCQRLALDESGPRLRINNKPFLVRPNRTADGWVLEWRLTARESPMLRTGQLVFSPVIVGIGEAAVRSAPVTIHIQRLPLPRTELPAIRLGVGEFTMRAAVEPSEVTFGQSVHFSLTIGGPGPLGDVARPPLGTVPGFREPGAWTIEELTETWNAARTERTFCYRLTPRRGSLHAVPGVAYAYFNPKRRDFAVETTEALPLAVRILESNRLATSGSRSGEAIPEGLRLLPVSDEMLRSVQLGLNWSVYVGLLLGPPAVFVFVYWRRARPVRSSGRSLSLSARRALEQLQTAKEPAEPLIIAVIGYLHERFGLPPTEPLAAEIDARLHALEIRPELIRQLHDILQAVAAARYGRGTLDPTVVKQSHSLIEALDRYL